MIAGILDWIIRTVIVFATAFLFAIVFISYVRVKNRKLLLISVGFSIFFAQALISLPELFYSLTLDENIHLLLHLVALIFILIGILKD
jgi:hypothetical protein